jgi:hypothetical protein
VTEQQEGSGAPGRREALLDQLEYLLIEVDALRPLLSEIPSEILRARPLDEPSIVDAFLQLGQRDRQAIHALGGGEVRGSEEELEVAAVEEIGPVLDLVQAARERLLETLRALVPAHWSTDVFLGNDDRSTIFELAYDFALRDAAVLRAIGERLRTARLWDRSSDS